MKRTNWRVQAARLQANKTHNSLVPGDRELWEDEDDIRRDIRRQRERDREHAKRRKDRARRDWPGDDASFAAAWPTLDKYGW